MSLLTDTTEVIEKYRTEYKQKFPNCNDGQIGYEEPPYTFVEFIARQLECGLDAARHLNWLANKYAGRLSKFSNLT